MAVASVAMGNTRDQVHHEAVSFLTLILMNIKNGEEELYCHYEPAIMRIIEKMYEEGGTGVMYVVGTRLTEEFLKDHLYELSIPEGFDFWEACADYFPKKLKELYGKEND